MPSEIVVHLQLCCGLDGPVHINPFHPVRSELSQGGVLPIYKEEVKTYPILLKTPAAPMLVSILISVMEQLNQLIW